MYIHKYKYKNKYNENINRNANNFITINKNTPKLNKVSITTTAIKYDYE